MVMMPAPLSQTIEKALSDFEVEQQGGEKPKLLRNDKIKTVYLTPSGSSFTQKKAQELSKCSAVLFVCGRYEGIDQRIIDEYIDEEISLGDYVIMGGETAAMVIIEAIVRLLPNVLGNAQSKEAESFSLPMLEHPHYTKPAVFQGSKVPEVLLSGNHEAIKAWRHEASLQRTKERRPDLLTPKNSQH
jgi:tRNA (guanine37-N1)-methyltransferase